MPRFARLWIVSKDVFSGNAVRQILMALADADNNFCFKWGLVLVGAISHCCSTVLSSNLMLVVL